MQCSDVYCCCCRLVGLAVSLGRALAQKYIITKINVVPREDGQPPKVDGELEVFFDKESIFSTLKSPICNP